MEPDYTKRELDSKFDALHDKLDTQSGMLAAIDTKITYTNGKVRKTIIALIAIGFFVMGLGFQQLAPVLKLLLLV